MMNEVLEMVVPDLFLLDCNMPVLSGFDLVPIIRSNPDHDETPIIFLTSDGSVDSLSVAVHLGASDFLVKPVDEERLHEKVAQHLSAYLIRRKLRLL
jgi:two-component system chemotaxis response regulator CheY